LLFFKYINIISYLKKKVKFLIMIVFVGVCLLLVMGCGDDVWHNFYELPKKHSYTNNY